MKKNDNGIVLNTEIKAPKNTTAVSSYPTNKNIEYEYMISKLPELTQRAKRRYVDQSMADQKYPNYRNLDNTFRLSDAYDYAKVQEAFNDIFYPGWLYYGSFLDPIQEKIKDRFKVNQMIDDGQL